MFARLCILTVVLAVSVVHVTAEPWYKTATSRCDDPLILRDVPSIEAALISNFKTSSNKSDQNKKYVELSARSLREKEIETGKRITISSTELSASDASMLKGVILHREENIDIPWFSENLIPDPKFNIAVSDIALETTLSYLISRVDAEREKVDTLAKFIAAGGNFTNTAYLNVDDEKKYTLYQDLFYTVALGKETRTALLVSCSYPVKVRVSEIKGYKDDGKQAFHIKDRDGTYWTMYRIDGSIGDYLKLYAEDDDFLYFNLYGTCEDAQVLKEGLCTQIRASTRGGKVEWRYNKEKWGENHDDIYGTKSITD